MVPCVKIALPATLKHPSNPATCRMVWLCGLSSIISLLLTISLHAQGIKHNTDSLKRVLPQQQGVEKINTLIALSRTPQLVGLDSAIAYAFHALHLAQETNDNENIIFSEHRLGMLYTKKKKADSLSLQYLTHALNLSLETEAPRLITDSYLRISDFYFITSDPGKSIDYANLSLKVSEKNNFKKQITQGYSALGDAYRLQGEYQNAIASYLKALRISEEQKDGLKTGEMFNSIGNVYLRTDDLDDALDYFNRALKINEARKDTSTIIANMLNIGVIHQKKKNYEEALRIFFKVLPMAKSQNDLLREAITNGNIGKVMTEQGKLVEGLNYYNKALALKEGLSNPNSLMHTLNDIAKTNVMLGDGRAAKQVAERVIQLAQKFNDPEYLRIGYENLSESYELLHDYKNAHLFLKKYNTLNDSLYGIEKAKQLNELQIQYNTEKKDMAITSLQQEKEIASAQRKVYFLIGAVVLLILAGLYFNQRQKTKRNQELLQNEREIDRLKSTFFANISHEFRTPLSLILGPVETMLAKIEDANHRFQLGLMKKNASRLLRLINQILELSKVQSGHLELKAGELDIVSLVKSVTATFQSLAHEKGIQLKFESTDNTIPVYGDQEQLETICINLISNAFKFTDTGGKIAARISRLAAEGSTDTGEVEIQVIDNGIGIAAEHVTHIFDRFYRAGSASEKQYGGTGIGLALTKELVELHSGTISVSSELGTGTAVTVKLPLGKVHLREDQVIEGEIKITQSATYSASSIEIRSPEYIEVADEQDIEKSIVLLIEDNEDVRSYIRSILLPTYTLVEANNGEEGITMAQSSIPDLIISDVMMPKMDGYEACRLLKKNEKTSHIPIILLTAKASLNSRMEGLETEVDLYLNKPFVPKELLLCMSNLIQSRKKLQERYNRQLILKPAEIAINSVDELFLQRLMTVLEKKYEDENFSVEELSTEIGMSRSQLHRKLHALTNESASQFIRSFRLQRAMEMLKKNHASISEIAFKVGFASHPYFNKCFLQHYGCTPSSVIGER